MLINFSVQFYNISSELDPMGLPLIMFHGSFQKVFFIIFLNVCWLNVNNKN